MTEARQEKTRAANEGRVPEDRAVVPVEVGSAPLSTLPSLPEQRIMAYVARSIIGARGHAVPQSIDSPAKAFAVILAGWELGVKPMTALRHVAVINGRTEPDGQLMMGIVRRSDPTAEFIFHTAPEKEAEECDAELRRDGKSIVRLVYTLADAKKAGLLKEGGGWFRYPRDMLRWHVVKRLCRLGASDCINAISFVGVNEAGDMLEGPEVSLEIPAEATVLSPAPDDLYNAGDEPPGEPEPPTAAETLPRGADLTALPIASNSDLLNAALKHLGYKAQAQVWAALGHKSGMDCADPPGEWLRLVEMGPMPLGFTR